MSTSVFLLGMVLLGVPLFAVIAAGALVGFAASGIDLAVVTAEFYRLAELPVLLAIPLFTFAGFILSESQAAGRLVRLTEALLGWLPGGLGIVSVFACAAFTREANSSSISRFASSASRTNARLMSSRNFARMMHPPRQMRAISLRSTML